MKNGGLLSSALFLLSCNFLPPVEALTCLPDWFLAQGKCYSFGENPVSWGDADLICRDFNGKLAELETKQESDELKNVCRTKKGYAYWIGGTDIFHEGSWVWVSTGETIKSFIDWGSNQPNENGAQDCLVMYRNYDYKWADEDCNDARLFICEAEALDAPEIG